MSLQVLTWRRYQPSVAGGVWRALPSLWTSSCMLLASPNTLQTKACLTITEPLYPCHPQLSLQHRFICLTQGPWTYKCRCPQHGKGDGNGERGTPCIIGKGLWVRLVSPTCETESLTPGQSWAPLWFLHEQTQTLQVPRKAHGDRKCLWGVIWQSIESDHPQPQVPVACKMCLWWLGTRGTAQTPHSTLGLEWLLPGHMHPPKVWVRWDTAQPGDGDCRGTLPSWRGTSVDGRDVVAALSSFTPLASYFANGFFVFTSQDHSCIQPWLQATGSQAFCCHGQNWAFLWC